MVTGNSSGKRIAKNTVLLYVRMAFVLVVNLYTVRLVLNALGAVDYGVYDIVAGIVIMFQSLSGVLSASTQRYYSYALGESDFDKFKKVYSSSINVFLIYSIVVLLISETVGLWFLNTHLDIPEFRIATANWIFHFSVVSFIFVILQIPFSAVVIANENMGFFAIISIIECILRLLTAVFISKTTYDRLFFYGLSLMIIPILSFICYLSIVKIKYKYCKYSVREKSYCHELLVFSGWTLFGTTAGVCMNQICTFLVNIFFGPVVNAARAIGFQVNNGLNSFCGSFFMAIRPPMIKAYAERDYEYLNILFNYSTKFIYYMLLILFIPLFLEMDYILNLWLKTTDSQAVLFSRLILIYTLILSVSNPITYIMHAGGFVKEYHSRVELPTLLVMPITYVLYKIGMPAFSTYIVLIIAVIASHIIRLWCLKHYYPCYSIKDYFKSFVMRGGIVTLISVAVVVYVRSVMEVGFVRLVLLCLVSTLLCAGMAFFVGLVKEERQKISELFHSLVTVIIK